MLAQVLRRAAYAGADMPPLKSSYRLRIRNVCGLRRPTRQASHSRSAFGGSNRFHCCVVALGAKTGEWRWHDQTTPDEARDHNSTMDIVLADFMVDRPNVKATLHAPRNRLFYVLNRKHGALISATPFVKVASATGIDSQTSRSIEIDGAHYEDGEKVGWPSALGGHSWHAMSGNADTDRCANGPVTSVNASRVADVHPAPGSSTTSTPAGGVLVN